MKKEIPTIDDLRGNPIECVKAALRDVGIHGVIAVLHEEFSGHDTPATYPVIRDHLKRFDQELNDALTPIIGDDDRRSDSVINEVYGISLLH